MATSTVDFSDLGSKVIQRAPGGGSIDFSDLGGKIVSAGAPAQSQWDASQESAHQTRMSALAGLTGMPAVNMTPQDQQSFQQGKAAGAVSVPVVAGATAGAVATPAVLSAGVNALLPAVTRGVVGVTAWAAQHPVAAKLVWEGLKAGLTGTAAGAGARFAGKIIKASGE